MSHLSTVDDHKEKNDMHALESSSLPLHPCCQVPISTHSANHSIANTTVQATASTPGWTNASLDPAPVNGRVLVEPPLEETVLVPEEDEPLLDDVPLPELPVPELPVPELPVPELPVPELPVPELPVPELPVPELPVPDLPFEPELPVAPVLLVEDVVLEVADVPPVLPFVLMKVPPWMLGGAVLTFVFAAASLYASRVFGEGGAGWFTTIAIPIWQWLPLVCAQ